MMRKQFRQSIVPFVTVAVMFVLTAFVGCEKRLEVDRRRGEDLAYKKALKETRMRQNEKAAVRVSLVSQMEELVARARAALPKDATDEQVRAELEENPKKYPGWKALSSALVKADEGLKAEMSNACNTVRARILKEAADRKAAAK